jgi:transcriptional regulator with GAF, ATPase, and Fis domain
VNALVGATRRLAVGDLRARSGLASGRGELSELAQTFDEMAEALERRQIEAERAAEELRGVNRALEVLRSCNQAMLWATGESELLHEVCGIIVAQGGYRLCWVSYAEQDDAMTVRPVARAGYDEGYLDRVEVTWADTDRGRGPVGTAIRTGMLALVTDMGTDPDFAPWRQEARQRGYASAVALPLVADSHTFGALAIYSSEPNAFDPEEVNLLTELANDLAYGIVALRTRADRERAEEALRVRTRQLEAVRAVTTEITRELDLTTLLGLIHRRAADLVGAAAGAVFLWDEPNQVLVPRSWHGVGDWMGEVRPMAIMSSDFVRRNGTSSDRVQNAWGKSRKVARSI